MVIIDNSDLLKLMKRAPELVVSYYFKMDQDSQQFVQDHIGRVCIDYHSLDFERSLYEDIKAMKILNLITNNDAFNELFLINKKHLTCDDQEYLNVLYRSKQSLDLCISEISIKKLISRVISRGQVNKVTEDFFVQLFKSKTIKKLINNGFKFSQVANVYSSNPKIMDSFMSLINDNQAWISNHLNAIEPFLKKVPLPYLNDKNIENLPFYLKYSTEETKIKFLSEIKGDITDQITFIKNHLIDNKKHHELIKILDVSIYHKLKAIIDSVNMLHFSDEEQLDYLKNHLNNMPIAISNMEIE